jgi:cis-L-3-hydroxyproline dehydratase
MTLVLTDSDRATLAGESGPAAQTAMRVIARMAEVARAPQLIDIDGAHIDSTVYIGDAGLAWAERLAGLGARVRVPTTLNVSGVDEHHWREWAVPPEWADKALRQMHAYQSMGTLPTWTCAPYQTEHKPRFGQQLAWGESNAIAFANSVIGARTERYPDLFDVCCAITGRAPEIGLHTDAGRAGQVLIELRDVPAALQLHDTFYPVLGHAIGRIAQSRVPVVDGLSAAPSEDQLKALCAAAACSGAVALCHIVGITPEAPTRAAALGSDRLVETHELDMSALRDARAELTHGDDSAHADTLDMVVLGSPHFSLQEFAQLAPLLAGQRKHPRVTFNITSSRAMTALADARGWLRPCLEFGAKLTVDTCILTTPMLPPEIQRLMTNSAKFAYYAPGVLDRSITFGSLEDCVTSAIAGRVIRDEGPWR